MVAQWARERSDLDTTPMALVARLGRAARYVDVGVEAGLAAQGLTRESWDVLASLRRSGPPHQLSPTALYRGLMRTSAAITYRLRRLERAGLISRLADPLDGRGVLVALTDRGRRLTDLVAPDHLETERRLLAALTAGEQAELTLLLRKLLLAFEAEQPTPPAAAAKEWWPRRRRRRA
ncbi:MAG TPA: MarR family transcriptional regulator [Candidatus Dormibacteraeota bacterium]|nr:MarR family transcriptional regulator [Candidatus Dormibacteraeota bacterium]